MPKVTGIFSSFQNLDQIPVEEIARWVKTKQSEFLIENYLANRILYPQTIPITLAEMQLDLAILREVLRRNPQLFKVTDKKILIPEELINRMANLNNLVVCFIDAYSPEGIVSLILNRQESTDEMLGSIVAPIFDNSKGKIELEIEGKKLPLMPDSVQIFPCPARRCHINFKASSAKLLGKNEVLAEATGGRVGLIVDTRRKKKV